jgi:DNA-binding beta-propeller fold protein YncE
MTTFGGSVLLYGGSGMSTFDAQTPRSTATERVVPVQVKQLAWDAAGGRLYATVGADAPQYANAVVAIDPANGQVTQSRALGTAPNALAVSGDGRYLYVGLDGEGSVQRPTRRA